MRARILNELRRLLPQFDWRSIDPGCFKERFEAPCGKHRIFLALESRESLLSVTWTWRGGLFTGGRKIVEAVKYATITPDKIFTGKLNEPPTCEGLRELLVDLGSQIQIHRQVLNEVGDLTVGVKDGKLE
jgi:hypothetical protein